jgi:hypothetical protein
VVAAQLVPEPEDAEVPLADVGVVEEHDRPVRKLGQPGLVIVADVIVVVAAVDVQEVDRAVDEMVERLVERRPDQARERAVAGVVVSPELLQDLVAIEPGVLVPAPRIDREATCP